MTSPRLLHLTAALGLSLALAGCGNGIGSGKLFSGGGTRGLAPDQQANNARSHLSGESDSLAGNNSLTAKKRSTIWDIFGNKGDPNINVEVNKYLWQASLQVLDFLPITEVDPFSGVIVTGYGTPPGGGRAYKATIYVSDPALDARSLKVSIRTRGGAVSPDTERAVEDAILTRARQLRIQDSNL